MEINIRGPIVELPEYQDEFVLTATAGFGNGDTEENVFIARFVNDEKGRDKLKEFIKVCDLMVKAYPQGRGGNDSYSIVPGYMELMDMLWIGDPATDYEVEADFNDYSVVYYDEAHIKHAVEVTNK